ncbi:MAG: hypothetical protein AAGB24_03240 [Bacteroidota bacterium]
MTDQEKQLKQLEVREKKLKNRTILLTAFIPIFTIVASIITTQLTISNQLNINKLEYTQEKINEILANEDIINSRKAIKFLIESDLIGNKENRANLIDALDRNLVDENTSIKEFLQGVRYFNVSFESKDNDTIRKNYIDAIEAFTKSLELNPTNYEARTFLAASYYNLGSQLSLNSLYEKALSEYNTAIATDSTHSYVYHDKAKTLEVLSRYEEACANFNKAKKMGGLNSLRLEEQIESRKTLNCPD